MENKKLDGQLSFDTQLDNAPVSPENKSDQTTVEFQIGKPEEKENLIFEIEKAKKEEKTMAEIETPIVEELVLGKKPESKVKKEELPPEPSLTKTGDNPNRRRTMYVPRFTEVSENYRRTIDYRTKLSAKEQRMSVGEVIASDALAEEFQYKSLDKSAVKEPAPRNQVFVNVTPTEKEPDLLNVFKFADDEEQPEPVSKTETVSEPTEEDERRSIESLMQGVSSFSRFEPKNEEEPEAIVETADVEETVEESVNEAEEDEELVNDEIAEETGETNEGIKDFGINNVVVSDPVMPVHIEEFGDNTSKKQEEQIPNCVVSDDAQADKKQKNEFTHQTQRDEIKDRFLDSLMAIKIRLGAMSIFAGILFILELLASLGVIGVKVFANSSFAGTLALVDLLLVSCVFVLALPEIARTVGFLFEGKLVPDLGFVAGFAVILTQLIILISFPEAEYSLYGFIFAIFGIATVYGSYFRTNGDFIAFKQVSQNTSKKILDITLTRDLEDENVALDGLVDEYTSKTSRIHRAAFVADFFAKTSEPKINNRRVALMIGVPMIAALISGLACFFYPGGAVVASSAFALVFLLGCPAFAMLSGKISYFDSQKAALSEESTVIGENSYYDFSEVDVIEFEDTEIFGVEDVNLKRFMLYGDRDNIEKAMRQMYSIFSVAGGPLYKIFAKALDNRVRHAPATSIEIEADGISGIVSGSRVYAGNDEYMKRHGIPVPKAASQSEFGIDTTKVMYAAENGEVYAKFYIRYSFSEEFTMLLPALKKEGIVPLIYTNDPNLSNELLRTLTAGADCMRVVKKYEPRTETERIYRRVTAGVVTYGDKINAINTVLLTRKYKHFAERISISELYSISIAAAAGAILSVFGVSLPSFVFAVWHVGGCAVLRLVSKKTFAEDKKEK